MSDNSPLCSPKNTNLNLRNGLPKSPDDDMTLFLFNWNQFDLKFNCFKIEPILPLNRN